MIICFLALILHGLTFMGYGFWDFWDNMFSEFHLDLEGLIIGVARLIVALFGQTDGRQENRGLCSKNVKLMGFCSQISKSTFHTFSS